MPPLNVKILFSSVEKYLKNNKPVSSRGVSEKLCIFFQKTLDNDKKGEQARGVGEGRLACSLTVV
jgi:hypothetical protein